MLIRFMAEGCADDPVVVFCVEAESPLHWPEICNVCTFDVCSSHPRGDMLSILTAGCLSVCALKKTEGKRFTVQSLRERARLNVGSVSGFLSDQFSQHSAA